MQRLGPRPQACVVQQRQQALVQAWETLKLRAEQRRAQLERAWLLARFHVAVRVLPSPELCVCVCVCDAVSVHALMRPSSSGGKTGVNKRRQRPGHILWSASACQRAQYGGATVDALVLG